MLIFKSTINVAFKSLKYLIFNLPFPTPFPKWVLEGYRSPFPLPFPVPVSRLMFLWFSVIGKVVESRFMESLELPLPLVALSRVGLELQHRATMAL